MFRPIIGVAAAREVTASSRQTEGGQLAELRAFHSDERGTIALIAALTLTLLAAFTGGAIDFGRAFQARLDAQATLDGAVLAAGRVLQFNPGAPEAAKAAGRSYVAANTSPLLTGATLDINVIGGNQVKAVLSLDMPTGFLGVVGMDALAIRVKSAIALASGASAGSDLEIAVMLDVTGSMCDDGNGPCTSGTKLSALKTAAADLANIVVWENQSRHTSRMAIVPFSTAVRVGPNGGGGTMMTMLTNLSPAWSGYYKVCTAGTGSGSSTSESHSGSTWSCSATETRQADNWKIRPCVTDRTGPQEFSDAYPGSGTWLNTIDGTRMPVSWSSIDEPPTYSTGATASDPTDRQVYGPDGSCWDVAEANEVLPLTSDKSRILQKIDRLEAFGATSGALGTAWAWYMLSPEWGSIFGSASRPGAYSDTQSSGSSPPALRKIAVLMSDGVFNTYRGWKDHDEADLAQRAKTLCANMKAKGIEIYTVGFDLDSLPSDRQARAIDTLKSCGSDLSHFYNAVDVEALRGAFRDIGTKVAVLRIAE